MQSFGGVGVITSSAVMCQYPLRMVIYPYPSLICPRTMIDQINSKFSWMLESEFWARSTLSSSSLYAFKRIDFWLQLFFGMLEERGKELNFWLVSFKESAWFLFWCHYTFILTTTKLKSMPFNGMLAMTCLGLAPSRNYQNDLRFNTHLQGSH